MVAQTIKKRVVFVAPQTPRVSKFTTKVVYVGVKHVWLLVMVCHQNAS